MGGGEALYAPLPPFLFACYSKYHEAPIPENSWPCKTFFCGCLYEKKIKKFSFTPLSEHFEIWVWKPAMGERVKWRSSTLILVKIEGYEYKNSHEKKYKEMDNDNDDGQ